MSTQQWRELYNKNNTPAYMFEMHVKSIFCSILWSAESKCVNHAIQASSYHFFTLYHNADIISNTMQ